MLFNKVTKEHILQGIKEFEEKSYPDGFGPSSTYDIVHNDKKYPPPSIMAYAYYHAEGKKVEGSFKVGKGTECFKVLEQNGFEIVKKNKHEKLYKLKQEFLNSWPIEKLEQMTLENYTNLGREDSFCYWLEHITRDLGSIVGGSSYKFGIYKMGTTSKTESATNRDNDGVYAWHTKYGVTAVEAFNSIKSIIISIANNAKENKLENIDALDLGNAYKWKIAFLYGDYNCLNIFKADALRVIASNFSIDYTNKTTISTFHKEILKSKPDDKDYFTWSHELWSFYQKSLVNTKYWLFAPGQNAKHWDEFYNRSIMALGWDEIGEINQYEDKDQIRNALRDAYGGDGNKMNNVTANYDIANTIKIGDVIIAKQGRSKLLGYGIVTSDYFYDEERESYRSCRSVDWKLKGEWNSNHSLVLKTLTDITKYESDYEGYKKYYEYLMDIMNTDNKSKLVEEFIGYLKTYSYAKFTIDVYANNFEICLKKYLKSQGISILNYNDYKFLSEITLEKFIEKTKGEHEGKGFSSFTSFFENKIKTNTKKFSATNQILYGPPGTGKTFYLKDQLFENYTSKETSISPEQHFETVVASCSWWQVIAIALLDIGNSKVSDIFNHLWVQKKASLSNSKTIRPTIWGQLQSHTINECEYVNVSSRQQPLIFNKTEDSYWEILEDQVKELAPELYDLKNSVENYNPNPDKVVRHYDFVTFHQSFAYEDFIEGIKPVFPENDEEITDLGYKIEDGVFKNLCVKAKNDPENRYAIFIDEINRGNVSSIFGELITLIETDKRQGSKNEMSIKLPYSKTEFSVPSNLDIYGTMNTADRSVEALDTALRRRFEFKEMMPDYNVIQNQEVKGISLSEVLITINLRIELLIDRDHTIGHSYFVNVDTEEKLANAFNNKIVPLLQEYFYGDYGKIGLVLGKGFVEKLKNDKVDFANFDYENANDFKIPSFKLKQVDASNVIDAIAMLYNMSESVR